MKLIIFFLVIGTLASTASTYSQAKKFDLKVKNATVEEILQTIEHSSEFIFVYDAELIKSLERRSISVHDKNIEEILKKLFQDEEVEFLIDDRQVFLYEKDKPPVIIPPQEEKITIEQPLTKVITGRVSNEMGQPLIGVSIVVKGTTTGVITDVNGNFNINAPLDAQILVFSYVGMKTQEIDIRNKLTINVILEEETIGFEEIVVVGYGLQKKESVVGAISQTSGEAIRQNIQGGDLRSGLRGSIPGLITLRTSGVPGGMDFGGENVTYPSGYNQPIVMYIRGQKTWNNAGPLVLVDGVERDLHHVNPYDIEQISVLKDASATAVFGVKGANGVILINTLRGKEGKSKLTFDYTVTAKTLSRIADKLNAYDAAVGMNQAILNEVSIREDSWKLVIPPKWVEYYKTQEFPYYFPDIDWQKESLKDFTIDKNMNLSLSGGNKFVKYHGAVAYLHETDLIDQGDVDQGYDPSFDFKRLNLRSNLDFVITSTTKLSTNLSAVYYKQKYSGGGNYAFRGIWGLSPSIFPVKYTDGTWAFNSAVIHATNPVWEYNYSGYNLYKGTQVNTDFILNQKLDYLTKGLSANARLSYDNTLRTQGPNVSGTAQPATKFITPLIVDDPLFRPDLSGSELAALEEKYTTWNIPVANNDGYNWTMPENTWGLESALTGSVYRSLLYEFSLNYSRDFEKHSFGGLALINRQIKASGSEFPSYREDWVGRITYTFDRRYLFEANAAYNGSEKFDKKYRFGFFPSLAVGWIVSNEEFFTPVRSYVNNLKFRYSDGIVGSDAGIARWQYTSSYIVLPEGGANESVIWFGMPYPQKSYPMRYRGNIANKDIHWEVSHKRDLGIEAGLMDNLIKINFDYYIENNKDIFVIAEDRIIPGYFGANPVSANIGKVNVHGWELEVEASHTFNNGLNLWASNSWSFAIDKIVEKGDPELKPDYQKYSGYQINQPRVTLNQGTIMQTWNDVYLTVGSTLNRTQVLPGDGMRVDFNSDGIIDSNDAAPCGFTSRPQYSYAPSAGMSYKNISANIRFYGVYNVAGDVSEGYTYQTQLVPNMMKYLIEESWSVERINTLNAIRPALRVQTSSTGGYIESPRSYLRLESAEIAYTLNGNTHEFMKRTGLSNLRFILSGNNLLLFSKMHTDKEYEGESTVDNRRNYPILKRYNLGVSIEF